MKKIFGIALCTIFAVVLFSEHLLAVDKGEALFTRTNLKTHGKKIFFHNLSISLGFIPVGTNVIVKKVGKDSIRFQLVDNSKTYILTVLSEQHNKYFVKDIEEIGLENISNDVKLKIKEMAVAPGMTKKEVYISRGCPSYIAYGDKSWLYTLDQVMKKSKILM